MKRLFKTESGMLAFLADQRAHGHYAWHVSIMHDDQCTPSRCTCRPWYDVSPLTAESVEDGAAAQAKWIKDTAS